MNYEDYYDKVFGGWLGRVTGSHFGAPFEFRPYWYIKRKYCAGGKKEITGYTRVVNPQSVNDDEIYEICGLLALEEKGVKITAYDIADQWNRRLYKKQYTAEKIALKNIKKGIMPPDSASESNGNYWFDAIGGQMKGDIWGLIAPNHPRIAAHYAQIDGSVAHQGVGIDGEVFIAAMIANAFGESNIQEIIHKSLDVLSTESVYREFVETTEKIFERHEEWRPAREEMMHEWHLIRKSLRKTASSFKRARIFLKYMHWLHVLPNAGIIVLSLLYGSEDKIDPFGRPICIAGMMGFDTDCNCGNIGTIMGTIFGAEKIPSSWKDPLEDTFNTFVENYSQWKISELAKRICDLGVKVIASKDSILGKDIS
ncbi:MAG: ADP-ribosylglycohydrolase family protein [Promethearchaeota archaeon]